MPQLGFRCEWGIRPIDRMTVCRTLTCKRADYGLQKTQSDDSMD